MNFITESVLIDLIECAEAESEIRIELRLIVLAQLLRDDYLACIVLLSVIPDTE